MNVQMKFKPAGLIMKALCLIATIFSFITLSAQGGMQSPNASTKLYDMYRGNDGGAFYMRKIKDKVFFFAENHKSTKHSKPYAYVFRGTKDGNTIKGRFWGVPKGQRGNVGNLSFQLSNGGLKLLLVNSTGDFPVKSWNKVSIKDVRNKLPGEKETKYSHNKSFDLDGGWITNNHTKLYIRQYKDRIIWYEEDKGLKDGWTPYMAGIGIFKREGNTFKGKIVDLPKGTLKRNEEATYRVLDDMNIEKLSSSNSSLLIPSSGLRKLPSIKLPLYDVLNMIEGPIFNRFNMRLDGVEGGFKNANSFITFNKSKPSEKDMFGLPTLRETAANRWHINNMDLSGADLKTNPQDPAKCILTLYFETQGREIECITRISDKVDLAQSGHIHNPRLDIHLKLVNFDNVITYRAEKVDWHGKVDINLTLFNLIDNAITKKVRPKIEEAMKVAINRSSREFGIQFQNAIDLANASIKNQLAKFNMDKLNLKVGGLSIQGKKLVVDFN